MWLQSGEEYKDKCVLPTVKQGGGSVMVWGCMSAAGSGELQFIEGIMNANVYFDILRQGSRVRPIWSHVHPNFSRVRLTKIPGRTGASSHSRKEKKKSIRNSETLVQQKTPPLGLYRGLNQSEIVKGGPPL